MNQLAKSITVFTHPIIIAVPTLLLVGYQVSERPIYWTALFLLSFTVPLGLFYLVFLNRLGESDWNESIHQYRKQFYMAGGVCFLLATLLAWALGIERQIGLLFVAAIIAIAISIIVNNWQGVSIHALALAGCVGAVWSIGLPLFVGVGVALMLLVAWARTYLNQQSWVEILTGWLIGLGSVWLIFSTFL